MVPLIKRVDCIALNTIRDLWSLVKLLIGCDEPAFPPWREETFLVA